ncbi:glycosyltransferase WbuB [Chlorobaculum sp. 24CR]|uniref:glycosyltransferase family 4 protein n=1 Tax=Chlorobaculum sp. 24CR TaxID=2508878 RepID=UPI00100C028F|nr:glycosyltransferase family 4 protein [Chlorobaculum sp. 24CR]RXK88047.1 glycosyltransferase WbuB [Chlorobaculum sp. 24CR]
MQILILTQWFDPEPAIKGVIFAKELVGQGFDVEVVTGFPNYPGGKLYPGYKIEWIQREVIDGVKVTRLPLYPSHNQNALERMLNYVSFSVSALLYGFFMVKRPDVIYAYHPPLTVGIAASFIRLFKRVLVVYDIQDMWPDSLRATGMVSNCYVLDIVGRICKMVYRSVDHIVVLSPGFKQLLIDRGVPARKIDVIYNWCDQAAMSNPRGIAPNEFPGSDRFTIVFAGNMGKAQALDTVLAAAEIVQTKATNICFVFIGGGVEVNNLKKIVKEKNLHNVLFFQAVPMTDMGALLCKADALLAHLKKDTLFSATIPSKTQAYMAAGKPLLIAVEGDAAQLVKDAGCGITAEPENPESIAEAAIKLCSMSSSERNAMGARGKKYYQSHLSLRVGVEKYAAIFKKIAR